jgi:hypothetical protein
LNYKTHIVFFLKTSNIFMRQKNMLPPLKSATETFKQQTIGVKPLSVKIMKGRCA